MLTYGHVITYVILRQEGAHVLLLALRSGIVASGCNDRHEEKIGMLRFSG